MRAILLALCVALSAAAQPCTVTFTVGATSLSALACGARDYFDGASAGPSVGQVAYQAGAGPVTFGSTTASGTVKSSNTLTKTYPWGTVATTYASSGNSFNITIVTTNTLSTETIKGKTDFSAGVLLPSAPTNITTVNLTETGGYSPTAIYFPFVEGSTVLTNPDIGTNLGVGMRRVHSNSDVEWNIMALINDASILNTTSLPSVTRNIAPGATDTYHISLVFGNLGPSATVPRSTVQQLAAGTFSAFGAFYPPTAQVQAARPIAGLHDTHNVRQTCATNPRGWQFFPVATCSWDTITPTGIAAFKAAWISDSQGRVTALDAAAALGVRPRGIVFWDFDGQQNDQAFVGDPTQIETISPETAGGTLDTVVNTFINAGYEVGFTLRAQAYSQQNSVVNLSGNTLTWVSGSQFSTGWVGNSQQSVSIWLGGNVRMNYNPSAVASATSMTLSAGACNPASASGTAYVCLGISSNITQAAIVFTPDVNGAGGATTINPGGGVKSLKMSDCTTNPTSSSIVAAHSYFASYNGSVWCIFDGNSIPMLEAQQVNDLTTNGGYQILHDKIAWCRNRWGPKANLFYVDSNILQGAIVYYPDANGFQQLQADFPGILIFPEWEDTGYWAYSSPYRDIRNYPPSGTTTAEAPATTFATYPRAQSIMQIDQASLSVTERALAIREGILHNNYVFYDVVAPGAGSTISFVIPYYLQLYSHPTRTIQ